MTQHTLQHHSAVIFWRALARLIRGSVQRSFQTYYNLWKHFLFRKEVYTGRVLKAIPAENLDGQDVAEEAQPIKLCDP